jgi:hypothetical protein
MCRKAFTVLVTAFAVSLTACGGAGSTRFPPIPMCEALGLPTDPQAALVAPGNGVSGVPVTVGTVSFVVGDAALRQGATFTLFGNGVFFTTTQIATAANGVMSVTIPPLQANSLYTAQVSAALPPERQTPCGKQILGRLGTFTTQ